MDGNMPPHPPGHPGGPPPARPPGHADVKPRLTKEQHEILEKHFQAQNKPTTLVKKDFAHRLGVPLEKVNNWFQNRRAKSKQEEKRRQNQQQEYQNNLMLLHNRSQSTSATNLPMNAPPMTAPPPQYAPNPQTQMMQFQHTAPVNQMHYSANANLSAPGVSAPPVNGVFANPGVQMPIAQQYYDQFPLGSILEAERPAFDPSGLSILHMTQAAAHGPSYMPNQQQTTQPQLSNYAYGASAAWSTEFVPMPFTDASAPPDAALENHNYSHANTSYLENPTSLPQDLSSCHSTPGTVSAETLPFPGVTTQAPTQMSSSTVDALTSRFSGYQAPDQKGDDSFGLEPDPSLFAYSQPWSTNGERQNMAPTEMYQQSNGSGHVVLTPQESNPQDHQLLSPEGPYSRRNSSTSNLASNIEAITIANPTSADHNFQQPTQPMTIAARRRKGPPGSLNQMAMRSASYTGLASPNGSHDHTLRRIKSSGITNPGRIQKATPGSAQRSPMTATFVEAAASPKFARTFSSSTTAANANCAIPAPPTPQTPNETGGEASSWAGNSVMPNDAALPEHSSPGAPEPFWSSEAGWTENYVASTSPPSTPLDYSTWNQTAPVNDTYRNTPPQSAPATQLSFPQSVYNMGSHNQAGFRSTTDLTVPQSNSVHHRRPSFHGTMQAQTTGPYALTLKDLQYEGSNDGMPMHGLPFAPTYDPSPWQNTPGLQGLQTGQPQKSYIFANQSAADFRSS